MRLNLSATHLSLGRRIWIAVSLVSVIPAVVILNYFFGYRISLVAAAILFFLIILGWWIIIEISTSIHKIHDKSKETLENIGEKTPVVPDEIQSLEGIINVLSNKVKTNFEELKEFGYKTEKLNHEISRKVLILSTILQANDLYSKDAPAQEVVQFLTYHLKNLLSAKVTFCLLRSHYSDKLNIISFLGIDSDKIEKVMGENEGRIYRIKNVITVDNKNKPSAYTEWAQELGLKNLILMPIASKGTTIGLVGVGNNKDGFSFEGEDADVLNLFAQNLTLIWEYERVSSKVEELELFDSLTGLYNSKIMEQKLKEEIKRGVVYQRPCGFIAVKIKNYDDYQKQSGTIEAEKIIKKVARAIKTNIRPIDIGGRLSPDTLAAILIEKNKRQSQEISDFLKEHLNKECGGKVDLGFCVAESPINGATASEILSFVQSHIR